MSTPLDFCLQWVGSNYNYNGVVFLTSNQLVIDVGCSIFHTITIEPRQCQLLKNVMLEGMESWTALWIMMLLLLSNGMVPQMCLENRIRHYRSHNLRQSSSAADVNLVVVVVDGRTWLYARFTSKLLNSQNIGTDEISRERRPRRQGLVLPSFWTIKIDIACNKDRLHVCNRPTTNYCKVQSAVCTAMHVHWYQIFHPKTNCKTERILIWLPHHSNALRILH